METEAKLTSRQVREIEKRQLESKLKSKINQGKTKKLEDVRTKEIMKKKEVNDAAKNSRDMLEQKVQQGLVTIQARR